MYHFDMKTTILILKMADLHVIAITRPNFEKFQNFQFKLKLSFVRVKSLKL